MSSKQIIVFCENNECQFVKKCQNLLSKWLCFLMLSIFKTLSSKRMPNFRRNSIIKLTLQYKQAGVIEIRDKLYKLLIYCHQYFSTQAYYTSKWEIHWNRHHQHFLFYIQNKQWKWHGSTWTLFWYVLPGQAKLARTARSCWHSPRCKHDTYTCLLVMSLS